MPEKTFFCFVQCVQVNRARCGWFFPVWLFQGFLFLFIAAICAPSRQRRDFMRGPTWLFLFIQWGKCLMEIFSWHLSDIAYFPTNWQWKLNLFKSNFLQRMFASWMALVFRQNQRNKWVNWFTVLRRIDFSPAEMIGLAVNVVFTLGMEKTNASIVNPRATKNFIYILPSPTRRSPLTNRNLWSHSDERFAFFLFKPLFLAQQKKIPEPLCSNRSTKSIAIKKNNIMALPFRMAADSFVG